MLIGQIGDFGTDGDSHYRLHGPIQFLATLPDITTVDCHFYHRLMPRLADHADVLVLQFINDWDLLALCNHRRRLGKITIFEANDFFFDLQPWSPIANSWSDPEVQELYRQLMVHADGVQTSTRFLAEKWREFGAKEVAVFENHLVSVPELSPPPDRPFTVGWAGSPGHFADLLHIVPMLERWLEKNPLTRLAIMTNDLAKSFFRLKERVLFSNFGSLEEYLGFLEGLDVGLAPLLPTDYNRGRSDVKFLEYSSRGVAGIYQNLHPYQGIVRQGENGFLCDTPTEMAARLDQLYHDQNLREGIRQRAHSCVTQSRVLSKRIGERLEWYQSMVKGPPAGIPGDFSNALEPYRERGNTFALKPGEEEKELLRALATPAPQRLSPLLALTEKSHPQALLQLPQCYNDQRQPTLAQKLVPQIKTLVPHSLKGRMELARAHFLLGDAPNALRELQSIVLEEPYYLPAWKYLLKLLALTKDAVAESTAEKSQTLFPLCYTRTALCLPLLPPAKREQSLMQLLQGLQGKLALFEIPFARNFLRKTILETLPGLGENADRVGILRSALGLFPDSFTLRQELASHLQRLGQGEEALRELALLGRARQALQIAREEGVNEPVPYLLQFADFIEKVLQSKGIG